MHPIVKAVASLAVSAVLALGVTSVIAPEAHASTRGCPYDSFCIYPENAYWNNNHPSFVFYPIWPHPFPVAMTPHVVYDIHGQYGTHKVYNNSYCFKVQLMSGHGGGGRTLLIVNGGRSYDTNLTPVNSVVIWEAVGLCTFGP